MFQMMIKDLNLPATSPHPPQPPQQQLRSTSASPTLNHSKSIQNLIGGNHSKNFQFLQKQQQQLVKREIKTLSEEDCLKVKVEASHSTAAILAIENNTLTRGKFTASHSTAAILAIENNTPIRGKFTEKDHILLLIGINIGNVMFPGDIELELSDLVYYVPLMLKVLGNIPPHILEQVNKNLANGNSHTNGNSNGNGAHISSLRTLVFFLIKSKVLYPAAGSNNWGKLINEDQAVANFLDSLIKSPPSEGSIHKVRMSDPVFGISELVTSVETIRIFPSQAKPCLLKLSYENPISPDSKDRLIIFKSGDDLTLDFMVQIMFFIFNKIWASSSFPTEEETPLIFQYRVVPTGIKQGCVEFISQSFSVEKFGWGENIIFRSFTGKQINRLLCTAAGGFIGTFVLGIRDRHRDNMMIMNDGTFFHIDFAYLFNKETWFDANRFAIPTEIKLTLNHKWSSFLNLCANAYILLRRNYGMITHFCTKLFAGIFPESVVREYLVSAFQLSLSEDEAKENIKVMVASGEASNKKKIKDMWHSRSTKKK